MTTNSYKTKILTIPNLLSMVRLALIPVIVWLYQGKQEYDQAGYLLILSGLTDIVDGFIARKFHMISDVGKVLDPIADKLTQAAMLFCLFLRYPLMLLPIVLMVLKEVFMAVTGVMVIRRTGIVLGANWHGKAATCMLYGIMFLHIFWHDLPLGISHLSIIACTGMIGLSFVLYALRNIRMLRN